MVATLDFSAIPFDKTPPPAQAEYAPNPPERAQKGQLLLFNWVFCPFGQRVQMVLDEMNVPCTFRRVVGFGGQFPNPASCLFTIDDLYQINFQDKPSWFDKMVDGRVGVPALDDGDLGPTKPLIYESLLISEYVAEKYDNGSVLPSDPFERYFGRLFLDAFSSNVIPAYVPMIGNKDSEQDGTLLEKFEGKLKKLDSMLRESRSLSSSSSSSSSSGPYLFGKDNPAWAEIQVIPLLARFLACTELALGKDTFKFSAEQYPQLFSFVESFVQRPSFQKSWGGAQRLFDLYVGMGAVHKRDIN